jgi:hypothetical protein
MRSDYAITVPRMVITHGVSPAVKALPSPLMNILERYGNSRYYSPAFAFFTLSALAVTVYFKSFYYALNGS